MSLDFSKIEKFIEVLSLIVSAKTIVTKELVEELDLKEEKIYITKVSLVYQIYFKIGSYLVYMKK